MERRRELSVMMTCISLPWFAATFRRALVPLLWTCGSVVPSLVRGIQPDSSMEGLAIGVTSIALI